MGFPAIRFLLALTLCLGAPPAHAGLKAAGPAPPFRAFTDDSFWNTPLPNDAPVRKRTRRMVKYLRRTNSPDHVGGNVEVKLENTVAERRGQLWDDLLDVGSLENIPLSLFQVVRYGYRP